MPVEAATFISQLNTSNPDGSIDPVSELDNHLRLVKTVLQGQFTALGAAAVTVTAAELNSVTGKAGLASPALTGTPTAPTATLGTNTTQLASTAFTQAAIANVNATSGALVTSVDSAQTGTLTAGARVLCTFAGTVTKTLPAAPTINTRCALIVGNGRTDTVVARNGSNIMGLAEDLTLDNANTAVELVFTDAVNGWRLA